jgi:hypothetical protein
MLRWLVVFTVVAAGCVASLPDDPSIPADLATQTALAIVRQRGVLPPSPPPAPAPKPGDVCPTCSGTGKLPTDGRVGVPCGECGGTGRVRGDAR